MDHQDDDELSSARNGKNPSGVVVTPPSVADSSSSDTIHNSGNNNNNGNNNNRNNNNHLPLSSPSRLHNSQSLPIGQSHQNDNQQWNSPMLRNHYYHHRHNDHDQEVSMDGLRVTTLVGLGGLIGWTAAAAYRWLNGGEFSMFPPPPTTTYDTVPSSPRRIPNKTSTGDTIAPSQLGQRQGRDAPTPWNNYHHHGDDSATVGQERGSTDELSKQVQKLVDALQKQSTQHREMMKRICQPSGTRPADDSVQRLRAVEQQQQQTGTTIQENTISSATGTQLALFCKLAEIQAELSSLRRDVQSLPERADKWDQRLSSTLEQVEFCLEKLKIIQHSNATEDNTLDTRTPVRSKIVSSMETLNNEDGSVVERNESTSHETGVHAVASALRQIVLENDMTTVRVCAQMLYMYTINLANQPGIPRYRKIFTSNESFGRVDKLKGGRELLRAVGFQDRDNVLEWDPGEEEDRYLSLLNEVSTALSVLKSPGQDTAAELLDRALSCLSLSVRTPATRSENNIGENATSDDMLPALYKTPDPSIMSPPATKKQVLSTDEASFSIPQLDVDSTTVNSSSFFKDNYSNDNDGQILPIEDMADADSVWK